MTTKENKQPAWAQQYIPQIGLGGVAVGNEFQYISDEEAAATLEAAWQAGVRYYDVSPWYGLGLAERRYGRLLHNQKRDEYLISSKVGKLLKASKHNKGAEYFPHAHSPNNVVFDYTADGVRRSVEDSLQRLGIDSLDIVFVHDLSPDNKLLPDDWKTLFTVAEKGGFKELSKMRDEGMIKGWGMGVNSPEPILKCMEVADPDVHLLASQYSLIDHANALNNVFPEVEKRNVALVMGSNLNAGFIPDAKRYHYDPKKPPTPEQKAKLKKLKAIANAHGVDIRTAALQFALFPPAAVSIIPGARTPEQVQQNVASLAEEIPDAFWQELKVEKLIEENAPTSK